ncbi:MAG: hypothetical protein JSW26_04340 [Desulfobacterales bacterium]|nr:MAG: hypothetical protein JSW26_04340 [Desulfobacterales bacterium]
MDKFDKYWKLSEMEERYNASSGGIRTLASAWILAALGAIGWLFNSYKFDNWPIPLGLLVVIVSLLATAGITTLWVMDQLVFHRLLNSVFLIGLKMEKDDPDLPPIRSMMLKTQEGSGTSKWELLFYLAPIITFILLSFLIIAFGMDKLFLANKELFAFNARLISWIFFAIQLITLFWVLLNTKTLKKFAKRASWFEDEEFTKIVSDSLYESIIAKYTDNANKA